MRISNKKLGLSKQLDNECFQHHFTVRWNPKKDYDKAKAAVSNVVKETGKVVSNVVKETGKAVDVITPDITIAKKDVSLKGAGKLTANIVTEGYNASVGLGAKAVEAVDRELLNDNLNTYSGGLIDDIKALGELPRNLAQGDGKAESNLKSAARVAAIATAAVLSGGTAAVVTTLGTSGMSQASWGQIAGGIADSYLPSGLGDIVQNVIDGTRNITEYTYTPSDAGNPIVLQDVVDSKIIPIMVVTVVLATSIILLKKKKK